MATPLQHAAQTLHWCPASGDVWPVATPGPAPVPWSCTTGADVACSNAPWPDCACVCAARSCAGLALAPGARNGSGASAWRTWADPWRASEAPQYSIDAAANPCIGTAAISSQAKIERNRDMGPDSTELEFPLPQRAGSPRAPASPRRGGEQGVCGCLARSRVPHRSGVLLRRSNRPRLRVMHIVCASESDTGHWLRPADCQPCGNGCPPVIRPCAIARTSAAHATHG